MHFGDVAPIDVEDDAPLGQLGDPLEVRVPLAFGIVQRLMAAGPKLLGDPLQRRPVVFLELVGRKEGHAAAVHPQPDRHVLVRIGAHQGDLQQVRRQGLAGGQHFLRLPEQVHAQALVAPQLVGQDVERRLENSGDRPHRSRLASQGRRVRPEGVEVGHHRHAALQKRHVAAGSVEGWPGGQTSADVRGSQTLNK